MSTHVALEVKCRKNTRILLCQKSDNDWYISGMLPKDSVQCSSQILITARLQPVRLLEDGESVFVHSAEMTELIGSREHGMKRFDFFSSLWNCLEQDL
jgi:protein involved in polysaccharide export with SLBB domain